MKTRIVSAGAIGGFVGTKLALAGQAQVSALARGAQLAALRVEGWRLQRADGPASGHRAVLKRSAPA